MNTLSFGDRTDHIHHTRALRKQHLLAAALLAAMVGASGLAQAETTRPGRAEVQAALAEALRTGDLPDFETGRKLYELFPGAYPKATVAARTPSLDILPAAGQPAQPRKAAPVAEGIGVFDYDLIMQGHTQGLSRQSPSHEASLP